MQYRYSYDRHQGALGGRYTGLFDLERSGYIVRQLPELLTEL